MAATLQITVTYMDSYGSWMSVNTHKCLV